MLKLRYFLYNSYTWYIVDKVRRIDRDKKD